MFFQVVFITIQTGVYALIVVRDPSAWELKLDMGLIVILYQVIIHLLVSINMKFIEMVRFGYTIGIVLNSIEFWFTVAVVLKKA